VDEKPKILIASVLKPVTDVRAYHKIGCSLAQTNKYDVNIIGFNSKKVFDEEKIRTHPIYNFKRLSLKRLFAPLKFLFKTIKVKPKLLIVTTPELLQVSYIYKIIFGVQLVYDVQENYYLNVKHSKGYSSLLKRMVLLRIMIAEWFSRWFVTHYFLAEKVYEKQLNFIKNKPYTIIENKVKTPSNKSSIKRAPLKDDNHIKFIISGTLGESYGTIEGLKFYQELHELYPNSSLTIIGYSASEAYFKRLVKYTQNDDSIHLISNRKPVEHNLIIDELIKADVALLPYNIDVNLKGRIPTKLYECMAYNLPMIIPENAGWDEIINPSNATIKTIFNKPNPKNLLEEMFHKTVYNSSENTDIYWNSEEHKLLKVIDTLI